MNSSIKHTAIIFGGYLYQNLVGIELLCDWLEDPSLFEWVQFESDHEETPRGLDDIVAKIPDGRLILRQVKFTVDKFAAANQLTWYWLLQHKPRGRSLIQKWASAYRLAVPANVADVALITNRTPDREFASCLDDATRRVDLARVPAVIRNELLEQLGGEDEARRFFDTFEFRHSQPSDVALERKLLDRFVPRHTDRHGFLALHREAIDWAVRKAFPSPDGRITLRILQGVLDSRRPAPLEQSFRVPPGYCVPDEEFDKTFVTTLVSGNKKVIVLWGSPGQGKSTYLSHVCARLEACGAPFIRHHYFLQMHDPTDRLSFLNVANSLMAQMEAEHTEHVQGLGKDATELRTWLEACADGYAAAGKQFLVIIDGLDHVWRENEQNKRPLDSLFRYLLPVPRNVTLVIGTQKVADEQLPSLFSSFVTSDAWIEVPRMALSTVKSWLSTQYSAGRFELAQGSDSEPDEPITKIAAAFRDLSNGHPLVLTYSFETLAREVRVLTDELVNDFPIRPSGDIRDYYNRLWQQLSFGAKDALHLVADADFIWPPLGLETCLSIVPGELNRQLSHLFYTTDAGQVPFHGSLLVFIEDDAEHDDRITALLPRVIEWLDARAPPFHRWGWLWIYQARAGSTNNLMRRPGRDWAIESLANAYPYSQVVEILGKAEALAFDSGDFPRAIELRWLKIRILNGKDFQLDDYQRLYKCTLQVAEDTYPLQLVAARFDRATIAELHLLATQYVAADRISEAAECQEQLRKRINDRIKAGAFDATDFDAAVKQYLEIAAATGQYNARTLLRNFRQSPSGLHLFEHFLLKSSRRLDLQPLMALVEHPLPAAMRTALEVAVVRLAGMCRAQVHDWPGFLKFRKHPISACWALLYAPARYRRPSIRTYRLDLDVPPHSTNDRDTELYLHSVFFATLVQCVELRGADPALEKPTYKDRPWLTIAAAHILSFAARAGAVIARGETPRFAFAYRLFDSITAPHQYHEFSDYVSFRRALMTISTDLFLLMTARSGTDEITATEWQRARASPHFVFAEWVERYFSTGYRVLAAPIVILEINQELKRTTDSITPFNERLEKYIELCELAISQALPHQAKVILHRAFRCVLGYGWRKDPTLSHVLQAVEAVADVDPSFARSAITALAPIITRLGDMTEDAGARESDLAKLLLKAMPERYVPYYDFWLQQSRWYTAEQVYAEIFAHDSLADPLIGFAASVVLDSAAAAELRKRAKEGDGYAMAILEDNASRFGHSVDTLGKERVATATDDTQEKEQQQVDPAAYGPSEIAKLVAELDRRHMYTAGRRAIAAWFAHWTARHQGIAMLRALEPFITAESVSSTIVEVFDEAFQLSLALEGKEKAYRWIVAAQKHQRGWEQYYDLSRAEERFKVFAAHYAARWQEFIYDTTRTQANGREDRIMPHRELVLFLLVVGQEALAVRVAQTMLSIVISEFEDQPLQTPAWLTAV